MKTADSSSIRASGVRLAGGDELRQEGEEEDRQFRIEDVDQEAGHDHPAPPCLVDAAFDRKRAALAQGLPGHVEQIDHPAPFQRRESQRARAADLTFAN